MTLVFDAKYNRDHMKTLALSEYYGFARLKLTPVDVTVTEQQLQERYRLLNIRVPEFIAGNSMVEVKRIRNTYDIGSIVRKACEKANSRLVQDHRVTKFNLCYVVPVSIDHAEFQELVKRIRSHTNEHKKLVCSKNMRIVFVRAPDKCFEYV